METVQTVLSAFEQVAGVLQPRFEMFEHWLVLMPFGLVSRTAKTEPQHGLDVRFSSGIRRWWRCDVQGQVSVAECPLVCFDHLDLRWILGVLELLEFAWLDSLDAISANLCPVVDSSPDIRHWVVVVATRNWQRDVSNAVRMHNMGAFACQVAVKQVPFEDHKTREITLLENIRHSCIVGLLDSDLANKFKQDKQVKDVKGQQEQCRWRADFSAGAHFLPSSSSWPFGLVGYL